MSSGFSGELRSDFFLDLEGAFFLRRLEVVKTIPDTLGDQAAGCGRAVASGFGGEGVAGAAEFVGRGFELAR